MSRLVRESGVAVWRDRDSGKVLASCATIRCVHCGLHDHVIPGSGRRRFYCFNCAGNTCGSPDCDVCLHWEQKLENIEANRDLSFKPIRVSVPEAVGLILPPELTPSHASHPAEVRDAHGAPDRVDVVPAGGAERGPEVQGTRAEALDLTAG